MNPTTLRNHSAIYTVALIAIFFSVDAQVQTVGAGGGVGVNLADHMLIQYAEKSLHGETAERIDGSPYLNDEFTKGEIQGDQGRYSDVMMRYNIFADHLEFKQNNAVYILDPNPKIMRSVALGDLTLVVDRIETNLPPGIFVLLASGKITLLLKKVIVFREKQEPRAIETTGKPAKYVPGPDITYFRIGNEKLTKVTNLKKMIATFPDHNEEMMQFAKENKISSNKPEELKLLVTTYNAYK